MKKTEKTAKKRFHGFFWFSRGKKKHCVKGGVLANNNIGIKKCTTSFLWVLNLGQVREILENFQKHPLGEIF